jgi:hypothetical protein
MTNKIWAIGIAVLLAGLAVAGCDESEQGRVLNYEKGTYLGKPDKQLSADQLDELRQRAKLQGGG